MTDYEQLSEELTDRDVEEMNALLPQLSASAPRQPPDFFRNVARESYLFVARDGGRIIGMACLVPLYQPFALVGRVEDVVVDESYRGRGIGRRLNELLIEKARELGMRYLDLTSRPSRVAANELYQSLGFQPRQTNVYRLNL